MRTDLRARRVHGAILLAVAMALAAPAHPAFSKGAPPAPAPAMKGVLKGSVLDEDGKPVAGAKVVVEAAGMKTPLSTVSDAQGAFAFPKAPVGPVKVRVTAKAHLPAVADVVVAGKGATTVDPFKLGVAVLFAGKVTDMRGAPVAGVVVKPVPPAEGADEGMKEGPSATTDAAGKFSIDGIAPATAYDLHVEHKHYKTVSLPGYAAEKGTVREDIDITLEDAAWIIGVVVDAAGKPVPGARIGETEPPVVTDAAGKFLLGNLDAEDTSFGVTAEGHFPGRLEASGLVAGKGQEDAKVVLDPATAWVSGTVVSDPDGKPVAGATVSAYGDVGFAGKAKTDATGAFRIERVASHDPVELHAEAPGMSTETAEGVALNAAGPKITLKLAARFKAKVVGPDGKIASLVIVIVGTKSSEDEEGKAKGTANQIEQGESGIDLTLPIGEVFIILVAPGIGGRQLGPYTTEAGKTIDEGTVKLQAGGN